MQYFVQTIAASAHFLPFCINVHDGCFEVIPIRISSLFWRITLSIPKGEWYDSRCRNILAFACGSFPELFPAKINYISIKKCQKETNNFLKTNERIIV